MHLGHDDLKGWLEHRQQLLDHLTGIQLIEIFIDDYYMTPHPAMVAQALATAESEIDGIRRRKERDELRKTF